MYRILLADDDPLTRAGIKMLLSDTAFEVVCEVSNGASVLEELPKARPDLLLLDFDMPERNGVEVLQTLRERNDERGVILLTGRIPDRRVYEAMQIGLNGLVIKASAPQNLVTCLEAVAAGRRWIDHEILQRAMEISLSPEAGDPFAALTARERAIAALVVRGLRNQEVASELGIGESTVKVHLHNIFRKLDISSRTELVIAATGPTDL
jgi:two-component system nitrate/nitrite response regulator NarP